MQLNVLDDLAEAMKALDGKKVSTTTVELRSHLRACIKLPTFGLDLGSSNPWLPAQPSEWQHDLEGP